MREVAGNIWDYHAKGHWIVITTNGTVRKDGACVMSRGVAKQAAQKFPKLPYELGTAIKEMGNVVHHWGQQGLILFPVKHNWWEKADLVLIEQSVQQLVDLFEQMTDYPTPIYLVRPGCGNGGLDWSVVKPVLEKYLDDRFVVV